MKKKILALSLCVILLLTGCAVPEHPDIAADGTPWGADWTNVGAVLGVEPVDGWTEQRSEDLLADSGMYFAAWTHGDPIRTPEGETSYPAQTFLVLSQCEDPDAARVLTAQWTQMAREGYEVLEERTLEHKLGNFQLISYRFRDESASFDLGLCALGVVGSRAINLELSAREDRGLDLEQTLTAFLDGFHFAD